MKNQDAVRLGRLGGRAGGPARALALSAARRSEIARNAVRVRWKKSREIASSDMTVKVVRQREASLLSRRGIDPGVAEQVFFMLTLPSWERLARGLRRARLGRMSP